MKCFGKDIDHLFGFARRVGFAVDCEACETVWIGGEPLSGLCAFLSSLNGFLSV